MKSLNKVIKNITTPIYYVNGEPHIGHAYTSIAADVICRFNRIIGNRITFFTGTDEYGLKVYQTALKNNISPQEHVDKMHLEFKDMNEKLNITPTRFIRTTDFDHKKNVQLIWKELLEKDLIYKGVYKGFYSKTDEAFYKESDLIEGKAPTGSSVEFIEEDCYFFRLSRFEGYLLDLYDINPSFVMPKSRLNEVREFVKRGLDDLAISRKIKWGISIPVFCSGQKEKDTINSDKMFKKNAVDSHDKDSLVFASDQVFKQVDCDESQAFEKENVVYVWLDALSNYLTCIKSHCSNSRDGCEGIYLNKIIKSTIHIIGKDILIFHAVYWPAILKALGFDAPLRVFAHGWWKVNDEKMSKSLGNTISHKKLLEVMSSDQLRFFLMKGNPFGNDGSISSLSLTQKINGELCNNFGNLVQRTIGLVVKYFPDGIETDDKIFKVLTQNNVDKPDFVDLDNNGAGDENNQDNILTTCDLSKKAISLLEQQKVSEYLDLLMSESTKINQYIDKVKPWSLIKTDITKTKIELFISLNHIARIALFLYPVIPNASKEILRLIGSEKVIDITDSEKTVSSTSKLTDLDVLDVLIKKIIKVERIRIFEYIDLKSFSV